MENQKDAITLIMKERIRQINDLGYSNEYIAATKKDYAKGQLSDAAAAYCLTPEIREDISIVDIENNLNGEPWFFPWDVDYWKPTPKDRIKELVKAGAMIIAEITRLQG